MNIITRNTDNVVIYAGDDIALTEDGATSQGGSFDPTTTTANATLIEGVTLPTPWTGGAYSYADDEWVVVDQGLLDALQPAAPRRWATKLAFRNRFTQAEKIALDLASIHDATEARNSPANLQAAGLRQAVKDQENAAYIDLDRADTRAGTIALEMAGLLAEGRALEVLDAPLQSHEIYQGVN